MKDHVLFRGDIVAKIYWPHLKIFSRTTGTISTKLSTRNLWVNGIQVCLNEGLCHFSRRYVSKFKLTCMYFYRFVQASKYIARSISQVIDVVSKQSPVNSFILLDKKMKDLYLMLDLSLDVRMLYNIFYFRIWYKFLLPSYFFQSKQCRAF